MNVATDVWRVEDMPDQAGRTVVVTGTTVGGLGFETALELEVDVIGSALPAARVREAVGYAVASAGIDAGHVAVSFVTPERIAELNETWRGKSGPTDVLSFPVDLDGPEIGERELGDVVICPEHTVDLPEAVVHGTLHLVGMDHETDHGEMLALQAEIVSWVR